MAKPRRLRHKGGAMISLQHLTKQFGTQTAVDDLSLDIPAGQIVGFLGPNGAGKSTTLKMLTGMIEPTSGNAKVAGFDLRTQVLHLGEKIGAADRGRRRGQAAGRVCAGIRRGV